MSLPMSLLASLVNDITSMPNVLSIPNAEISPLSTEAVNLSGAMTMFCEVPSIFLARIPTTPRYAPLDVFEVIIFII